MSFSAKICLFALVATMTAGCADFRRGPYWDEETGAGDEAGADDTGPPDTGTDPGGESRSFATDVYPLLQAGCARCHSPTGAANGTDFLITDDVEESYQTTLAFVDPANPASSRLLAKGSGSGHAGGAIYDERSQEYQIILQWIEQGALP